MAHLYIHIPFCKQKCRYCDFYSIANLKHKEAFLQALVKELELQQNYLESTILETLYLGGGTPSVLSYDEWMFLFDAIAKYYNFSAEAEITMECNPDDLNKNYIADLRKTPVNRVSVGGQSFDDALLKYLNRRHTGAQVTKAIRQLQESGFQNISLDLIFGIPSQTQMQWEADLQHFFELEIEHLSAYLLTIEPQTVFGRWQADGKLHLPTAEQAWRFYETVNTKMKQHGYDHYEISNYAKSEYFSKHNTAYWQQKPYLGIGPSAHSYNEKSRQWNDASVTHYITSIIEHNKVPSEIEYLSDTDKFNDFIITRLRTKKGFSLNEIKQNYADYESNVLQVLNKYHDSDLLIFEGDNIRLTENGFFVSDSIMLDLIS